ncbi:ABC transporter substrate-binding protein [Ramlibacter sp. AN1015]|uniref:ABC transporter substrate-binding protein n=1 Tax=Ramlibacter sp. AN1015 TaxID=3133428 RepID=UPI0030C2FF42
MTSTISRTLAAVAAGLLLGSGAHAQEKFTYMTNWYAQAEHGGFYQAVATGLYKKHGLDVTIRMGGPQVNILQLMAAGQTDCIMGSSDMQMMVARAGGLPVVTVAAIFQKDPQVFIAHEHVKSFEDMKDKNILIAPAAQRGYWLWLKKKYGLQDSQARPYTFNIQPFVADRNTVQQGYLTSEPFAIQKAGVKANTFLFADHGWTSYATTISCMEDTVKTRASAVDAFVKATMEGWKSFLADPAPGAALIKKDNPNMTDEQIAYSVGKLKEMGMVTAGEAKTQGIGTIDANRVRQNFAFLVENKLVDAGKLKPEDAFKLDFIQSTKVLP